MKVDARGIGKNQILGFLLTSLRTIPSLQQTPKNITISTKKV